MLRWAALVKEVACSLFMAKEVVCIMLREDRRGGSNNLMIMHRAGREVRLQSGRVGVAGLFWEGCLRQLGWGKSVAGDRPPSPRA